MKHRESGGGGFIYVAGDERYATGVADTATVGPVPYKSGEVDFFESPFYVFWTTQHYFENILGVAFGAMPVPDDGPNAGNFEGRPRASRGNVDGFVLANLRLSDLDSKELEYVVFDSYAEFLPSKFTKKINRNLFGAVARGHDEIVFDIGSVDSSTRGYYADKPFGRGVPMNGWVRDYGYIDGAHSTYENPGVGRQLSYYRTNRNGSVVYKFEFDEPVRLGASFDFWEQWGRGIGERVFDLDVSWDGGRWVGIGRIDAAALNGGRPFSIDIVRAGAMMMQFRLVPVKGDVPMIQGVRLRRLD